MIARKTIVPLKDLKPLLYEEETGKKISKTQFRRLNPEEKQVN